MASEDQDLRQRILDAAVECAERRGDQSKVTVGEIISDADVTRRVFYELFASRADCYRQASMRSETEGFDDLEDEPKEDDEH